MIHDAVKNALMKDGWIITDDPYIIQYRRTTERNGHKLVVEVKSFVGASKIQI
nr:element excision factor XisH family protein [Aulosira sp. ZfuVER01]